MKCVQVIKLGVLCRDTPSVVTVEAKCLLLLLRVSPLNSTGVTISMPHRLSPKFGCFRFDGLGGRITTGRPRHQCKVSGTDILTSVVVLVVSGRTPLEVGTSSRTTLTLCFRSRKKGDSTPTHVGRRLPETLYPSSLNSCQEGREGRQVCLLVSSVRLGPSSSSFFGPQDDPGSGLGAKV